MNPDFSTSGFFQTDRTSTSSAGGGSSFQVPLIEGWERPLHFSEIHIGRGPAPAWMDDVPQGVNHHAGLKYFHGGKQEGKTKYSRTRRGEGWIMADYYGALDRAEDSRNNTIINIAILANA